MQQPFRGVCATPAEDDQDGLQHTLRAVPRAQGGAGQKGAQRAIPGRQSQITWVGRRACRHRAAPFG